MYCIKLEILYEFFYMCMYMKICKESTNALLRECVKCIYVKFLCKNYYDILRKMIWLFR